MSRNTYIYLNMMNIKFYVMNAILKGGTISKPKILFDLYPRGGIRIDSRSSVTL